MLFDDFKIISKKLSNKNKLFNNRKILITGALGFVGINFLKYFFYLTKNLKINIKIIAMDNREPNNELRKIFKLKNFFFKKVDLSKLNSFPKVDYIIHAASNASPLLYRKKA